MPRPSTYTPITCRRSRCLGYACLRGAPHAGKNPDGRRDPLFMRRCAGSRAERANTCLAASGGKRPARRSGTRGRHRTNGGRPRSGCKRQRHGEVQRHAAHRRRHERARRGCEISGRTRRERHCRGQLLPLQRRRCRAREQPYRHLALSSRQRMAGRRRSADVCHPVRQRGAREDRPQPEGHARERRERDKRSGALEETRVCSCSESIARRIAGSTGLCRRRRDT